ncbi:hypothetical protein AB395_00006545 (plasmid) [Sinorhizobium fredii CCBAU 45436]|nr:hypothetical protein AB395_00006545 [Sinorhizobium fredii CCBAU 45436]
MIDNNVENRDPPILTMMTCLRNERPGAGGGAPGFKSD